MRLQNFQNVGHFQNGLQNTQKTATLGRLSVTASCYCHNLLLLLLSFSFPFFATRTCARQISGTTGQRLPLNRNQIQNQFLFLDGQFAILVQKLQQHISYIQFFGNV